MIQALVRETENIIADLRSRKERLETALAETEADIDAAERFLLLLAGSMGNEEAEPQHVIGPDDIASCKTQRSALYEIAKRNKGIVKVTDAGNLIQEAGLSAGKTASVIATIHNFMSESDDWEWIEPGSFRLSQSALVPSSL
jgi:hypothetical protein